MLPHFCPRNGLRGLTPRFCAAGEVIDFALEAVYGLNNCSVGQYFSSGAGGVTTVKTYDGGGAPAAKLSARNINAWDKAAPLKIYRAIILLLREHRGAAGLGALQ
jgi:hypothetical protein